MAEVAATNKYFITHTIMVASYSFIRQDYFDCTNVNVCIYTNANKIVYKMQMYLNNRLCEFKQLN